MGEKKRKNKSDARPRFVSVPPAPLDRAPRTDLEIRIQDLDELTFRAVDIVADALRDSVGRIHSLEKLRLAATKAHVLEAMKSTHKSMGHLIAQHGSADDLSVDGLLLARLQLERCFLGVLLEDNPRRWFKRYQKNAWKALAEKFFRDQRTVGHLDGFSGHFGSSGTGVSQLRKFAREMDVNEDEIQTVRIQVLDEPPDPRYTQWFIPDMPTPGKALSQIKDPAWKDLAEVLYPYYDNLSHFSHSGMMGVLAAAILRPDTPGTEHIGVDREGFWQSNVMGIALPASYVSMLLTATMFALSLPADETFRAVIAQTWQPYHSDGSPMGIAVWDNWARDALGASGDS